jgi:formylglycine-generating enzyme required for sulfatase activity
VRRGVGPIAFAFAIGAFPACAVFTSFDGFGGGSADATATEAGAGEVVAPPLDAEAGSQADAGADADATSMVDADAAPPPGMDADAEPPADALAGEDVGAPDGGCPVGAPGPAMVRVGTFCIDSTEVTVGQYKAFLAAAGTTPGTQPATCNWNTSNVPQGWTATGNLAQALQGVNWCQAYLYCAWAGKRLCGNPDGGSADPRTPDVPGASQWFQACSHDGDGQHAYPYGNSYDPSSCNGADYEAGAALPSVASCQGGYPGLFDMSGNVMEWEDSCTTGSDPSGMSDMCNIRGGAFWSPANGLGCARHYTDQRNDQGLMNDLGVRCCSK